MYIKKIKPEPVASPLQVKTINISNKCYDFLKKLSKEIKDQDNRATRLPIYFTVAKTVTVPVPDGCGDSVEYFDGEELHSEGEVREYCKEEGLDFDEYVESYYTLVSMAEKEEFEGFFLTESGYKQHIALNGHNIKCKSFQSYVNYLYRNPQMEGVIDAIHEIAESESNDV